MGTGGDSAFPTPPHPHTQVKVQTLSLGLVLEGHRPWEALSLAGLGIGAGTLGL